MKEFLHKKRLYLSIFVYLLLMAALLAFITVPLMKRIQIKMDEFQKKNEDYEIRRNRLGEIPRLKVQFEMAEIEESNINFLLDKNNTINLIERIENLSSSTGNEIKIEVMEKESNLTVENIEMKQKEKSRNKGAEKKLIDDFAELKYLKFKINIKGKYDNFVNFVEKIENLNYHSDIIAIKTGKVVESKDKVFQNPYNPATEKANPDEKKVENDILESSVEILFYLQ